MEDSYGRSHECAFTRGVAAGPVTDRNVSVGVGLEIGHDEHTIEQTAGEANDRNDLGVPCVGTVSSGEFLCQ